MKFIEFGLGNKWILRTETELSDGTEFQERGIVGPIKLQSVYLRVWLGKTVIIIDSKEGYKKSKKNRKEIKIIIGVKSR